MTVHYHKGDLPAGLDFGQAVAVDTETMGLSLTRDMLCVVQLSAGDGDAHVVQMDRKTYDCPNLKALLADPGIEKILHFARFDVAMIERYLNVTLAPVFCTKIASKLARTYTDRHGLKDVTRELVGVEMNKQQQSSDWGAAELSPGPARIRRFGRALPAPATRPAERDAGTRGPHGARTRLFRLPADPGPARPCGLAGDRHFRALLTGIALKRPAKTGLSTAAPGTAPDAANH